MGTKVRFRVLIALAILCASLFGGAQSFAAQPGQQPASSMAVQQTGEGFPLPASAAFCPPEHGGPFVDCTPWEGVTVSFEATDGVFSDSCTTAGTDRAASCEMWVPFGSTIIASIDPAVVPAGYALVNETTQTWEIPDGPPEGVFGGPTFVLNAVQDGGSEGGSVAMPVYASLCADGFAPHDDCTPWEGAVVTVTSADDDSFIGECTTETFIEYAAGCEVTVERGTSVVATMSLDTLPEGYQLATVQMVVDVPAEGDVEGPMFLAIPADAGPNYSPLPVYASICSDALPPNDDCSPWEGVVISAETADGSYNDTCTTATFFETVAGCEIPMPRGTNVTAYISEEQIPEGYELFVEVPTWDIPAEGDLESGPYFFLVPVDGEEPAPAPTPAPTAVPGKETPVTQLPTTGSGQQGDSNVMVVLAGMSAMFMLGGTVVSLRKR